MLYIGIFIFLFARPTVLSWHFKSVFSLNKLIRRCLPNFSMFWTLCTHIGSVFLLNKFIRRCLPNFTILRTLCTHIGSVYSSWINSFGDICRIFPFLEHCACPTYVLAASNVDGAIFMSCHFQMASVFMYWPWIGLTLL